MKPFTQDSGNLLLILILVVIGAVCLGCSSLYETKNGQNPRWQHFIKS
jgi:hypothetical protein